MNRALQHALKIFIFPGDVVANRLGAVEADDRTMIRTLINMLFWNAVIVVGLVAIFL